MDTKEIHDKWEKIHHLVRRVAWQYFRTDNYADHEDFVQEAVALAYVRFAREASRQEYPVKWASCLAYWSALKVACGSRLAPQGTKSHVSLHRVPRPSRRTASNMPHQEDLQYLDLVLTDCSPSPAEQAVFNVDWEDFTQRLSAVDLGILSLRLGGLTLREVADRSGWSFTHVGRRLRAVAAHWEAFMGAAAGMTETRSDSQ